MLVGLHLVLDGNDSKQILYLSFASRKFAADVRHEGRRCISILQALRNEIDAVKSRNSFLANKSRYYEKNQLTHQVTSAMNTFSSKTLVMQAFSC